VIYLDFHEAACGKAKTRNYAAILLKTAVMWCMQCISWVINTPLNRHYMCRPIHLLFCGSIMLQIGALS